MFYFCENIINLIYTYTVVSYTDVITWGVVCKVYVIKGPTLSLTNYSIR